MDRRTTVAAIATCLCAAGCTQGHVASQPNAASGVSGDLPGPAPLKRSQGFDAARVNQGCVRCHTEIADEWQRSLHRHAIDDPVFQAALAIEPTPFCRKCHAPESDPSAEPDAPSIAIGIGCTSCHVSGSHILARETRAGSPSDHPVLGDPRIATAAACRGCHQFTFPNRPVVFMQSTLDEHARSSFSQAPCQACHMRKVAGAGGRAHSSHDFAVQGRAEVLRSALVIQAARLDDGALVVTLEAGVVGHAVPTGDVFRRLEVSAAAMDGEGRVVSEATPAVLEREFAIQLGPNGTDRIPVADRRVPPPGSDPPREVTLRFPAEVTRHRVQWRVLYRRMDPAMSEVFGIDPDKDAVFVAGGIVGPVSQEQKGP